MQMYVVPIYPFFLKHAIKKSSKAFEIIKKTATKLKTHGLVNARLNWL
jgi:hypothetical protein